MFIHLQVVGSSPKKVFAGIEVKFHNLKFRLKIHLKIRGPGKGDLINMFGKTPHFQLPSVKLLGLSL